MSTKPHETPGDLPHLDPAGAARMVDVDTEQVVAEVVDLRSCVALGEPQMPRVDDGVQAMVPLLEML